MLPTLTIEGLSIPSFPIVLFLAFSISLILCFTNRDVPDYLKSLCLDALPAVTTAAVIGGRLLFVLVTPSSYLLQANLLGGGTVFYGCLFGGLIGLSVWSKIKNISFPSLADCFALYLPFGQSIGRFGCFLNGCCYGKDCHIAFLGFPYFVDGVEHTLYPVWFYEVFGCLLLFLFLLKKYKSATTGSVTGDYLTAYSVLRFIVEFFRGDSVRGYIGYLSTSQVISLLLCFFVTLYRLKLKFLLSNEGREYYGRIN